MKKTIQKSGQKFAKKLSKISRRASQDGKEHIQENLIERFSHIRRVRILILEWVLLVGVIIFLAITQAFWYSESYVVDSYGEGGAYTEGTLGKINSLNPLFATTSSEKTLSKLLFATLTTPDYSGRIGLDLADSVKSDDSAKTWTVKLRDQLKWSDGTALTNQDVIFTVKLIQNSRINTAYASSLSGVKVSEQDGRLVFQLPAAYVNFPASLDFPILPAHILKNVAPEFILEHNFSSKPVSSGPFTYNATQTIGSEGEKIVYLSPSPSYYKGKTLLTNFTIHAYLTPEAIKSALKAGSITATAELLPSDGESVRSNFVNERQSALGYGVFAFLNTESPLLKDRNLRQIIRQGLNLEKLRFLLDGEPKLDYPLLPTQVDLADYPKLPDFDPAAAKQALEKIRLPLDINLNLVTISTGRLPALADNLAKQLTELGLPTTVEVQKPNQDFLVGIIRPRAYDILLYEVELGPDPDLFAYYHSSQASGSGLNLSNFRSPLVDDLILGARSTTDAKLRQAKYRKILDYWVSDVPAIGIYQTNLSYYVSKNVRTFSENHRLAYPVDRFNDVINWAVTKTTKNRTP